MLAVQDFQVTDLSSRRCLKHFLDAPYILVRIGPDPRGVKVRNCVSLVPAISVKSIQVEPHALAEGQNNLVPASTEKYAK